MKEQEILNLADVLGRMKRVKRTGWMRRMVVNPESDADHTFSLAMLVMLFAPAHLDRLKCLQLALVHDLPEAYCGDFAPDDIAVEEKADIENVAMKMMASKLNLPQLQELFDEYNRHETPESQFVWVLDRIDNVFTARHYEDTFKIGLVREFAESAYERLYYLNDAELRAELDGLLSVLTKK